MGKDRLKQGSIIVRLFLENALAGTQRVCVNERGPEPGKAAPVEQKHSRGRQEGLKAWFKVVSLDNFFFFFFTRA